MYIVCSISYSLIDRTISIESEGGIEEIKEIKEVKEGVIGVRRPVGSSTLLSEAQLRKPLVSPTKYTWLKY